jgi:hypothetical protein
MKSFTVTLVFESIKAEDALAAAKIVADNFLDDPDELSYRVMNEETKAVEDIEGLYDEEEYWEDEYDDEDWEDEGDED